MPIHSLMQLVPDKAEGSRRENKSEDFVARVGEGAVEAHAGARHVEVKRHRGAEGATGNRSRAVATRTTTSPIARL